jgi:hypothetical protein
MVGSFNGFSGALFARKNNYFLVSPQVLTEDFAI